MRSKRIVILVVALLLLAAACSVEISSDPPAATSAAPAATATTATEEADEAATEAPAATSPPEVDAAEPEVSSGTDGEEAATAEPAPAVETEEPEGEPPPWAALGLTGELVFIAFDSDREQNIYKLDLVTGELLSLFEAPEGTLLTDVAASPDGNQIVFAFAPPVPEGEVQFGFTDLYTMPADGSADAVPVLERTDSTETFFNLSWPLEDMIYYAHFAPTTGELGETVYLSQVERMRISDGATELLAETASWPRVSRDGSRLAYVNDINDLIIADPDGSNASVFIEGESYPAIDAPFFSLENEWLYFSAIDPAEASLSWLDRLLGVRVASAHNVPSDWWRQPLAGDGAERLTNIFETGMYGDISEDDAHIAFITSNGVQVMNPDGSGVFRLLEISATGTLNWIW